MREFVQHSFFFPFCKVAKHFINFFLIFLMWSRLCRVPNAFACLEIITIATIFLYSLFFKHTAIFLNTTVHDKYFKPPKLFFFLPKMFYLALLCVSLFFLQHNQWICLTTKRGAQDFPVESFIASAQS